LLVHSDNKQYPNPMKYDPEKHHRRSIRLKGYDYSRSGLFFITLCCEDRKVLFGEIENGMMNLNAVGRIVEKEWVNTIKIRKNIALHEFIIMPDHFHAIIEILYPLTSEKYLSKPKESFITEFRSPSQTIGAIIRGFKGASTRKIKEFYFNNRTGELQFTKNSSDPSESIDTGELQFAPSNFAPSKFSLKDKIWQRNYYEHIIRSKEAYIKISAYIRNNPLNWDHSKNKETKY